MQNNSLGLNAIDEVLVALDHLCGLDHVSHIQIRQLPVTLDHIAKSAVTAVHEIAARSHELGVKEKEEPLQGWKTISVHARWGINLNYGTTVPRWSLVVMMWTEG